MTVYIRTDTRISAQERALRRAQSEYLTGGWIIACTHQPFPAYRAPHRRMNRRGRSRVHCDRESRETARRTRHFAAFVIQHARQLVEHLAIGTEQHGAMPLSDRRELCVSGVFERAPCLAVLSYPQIRQMNRKRECHSSLSICISTACMIKASSPTQC